MLSQTAGRGVTQPECNSGHLSWHTTLLPWHQAVAMTPVSKRWVSRHQVSHWFRDPVNHASLSLIGPRQLTAIRLYWLVNLGGQRSWGCHELMLHLTARWRWKVIFSWKYDWKKRNDIVLLLPIVFYLSGKHWNRGKNNLKKKQMFARARKILLN